MAGVSLADATKEVARRDRVLAKAIARLGPLEHSPRDPDGPFGALARAIVYQQLAGRAALTRMLADLPEDVLEDYLSSYAGDRFVESAASVRSYPQDLPVLAEMLARIETPVQIITGRHDDLVPPANAEFLHERLPKSKLDILDTGHFVWEEAAEAYAAFATSWWAGGYADV